MNKYSLRALAWGLFLVLLGSCQVAVPHLFDEEGVLHTLDLPPTWNASLYTDISAWIGRYQQVIHPDNPQRVLDNFQPGDHVEIRCWRFSSLSGDRTALLLYVLNGPRGYRWVFATSNTGLFGALLTAALLPFLLIAVGAAEARSSRRAPG